MRPTPEVHLPKRHLLNQSPFVPRYARARLRWQKFCRAFEAASLLWPAWWYLAGAALAMFAAYEVAR